MPDLQDKGFIVKSLNYSETSLIITWITKRHGIISTIAKGARRSKQKLYSKTDLFYEALLTFRSSTHDNSPYLHQLIDIELINQNKHVSKSYQHLLAATVYFELINHLVEQQTPVPELYDLFTKAIEYLDKKAPSKQILHRYERHLYMALGLDNGTQSIQKIRQRYYQKIPKSLLNLEKDFSS